MLVSCLGPRLGGEIMGLRGLIMGLRGLIWGVQELIWGLRGLILSSRDQISGPSRLDEGLRPLKGGDGRKDGRTVGRTDVWKLPPVSYRTSALWGRCPALTPLFHLITPSRASRTVDHVRSLDD